MLALLRWSTPEAAGESWSTSEFNGVVVRVGWFRAVQAHVDVKGAAMPSLGADATAQAKAGRAVGCTAFG
jgi:hypothetical protein